MQRLVESLVLGLAAANNIVNPTTKMCLEATEKKKGASLFMQPCTDDASQNFAIISGRIRALGADEELCIDIKALCVDGSDAPGCERQDVGSLTEDAEIQLWNCRKDDEEGRGSSSYGNQKWDLLSNGYLKNEHTGLCLVAHHEGAEAGKVHVHTCPAKMDQEFVLDLETGDLAAATSSEGSLTVASHACPTHSICEANQCTGKSCMEMLSEKMKIANALDGDTESNNPNAHAPHSKCKVATQLLFDECEMCNAARAGCPNKLFSMMEIAKDYLPLGTSRTGVAVATGLAAATALAATLAIARSRRAATQLHLLQELDEAAETTERSAMKTEA